MWRSSQPTKPAQFSDADWNKQKNDLEGNLHATLGFIALNGADYPKAVEHYEAALKSIPKDGIAHFRLGLAYQFLTSDASKAVVNAIKAENDAKTHTQIRFRSMNWLLHARVSNRI